jgi:formylglycine-generating enzyme required for sulfatase activity
MGNAATLRKKQAADLQTMKTTFQAESDKKLASLRDETTSLAEADKILEAIKMLFSGDTRASPGENFTNSAGIELVWVAEGNFWIGKTEVTGKQYNFVINGAAEGSDEPKDGVNFNNAIQYCEQLTAIEEGDSAVSDSNLKLRPEASAYMLPAVEQWNSTRTSPASTAVEGFSNELHEWSSSTYGGGGNYDSPKPNFPNAAVRPRYWTPSSDSPLVLRGNARPISLSPNTTSTIAAVFLGKSYPMWSGRLGFRVILISKP